MPKMRGKMQKSTKTQYDYMKESEFKEEDAFFPEEVSEQKDKSEKEKYFDFYDDVKTSIKEDW